MAKKAMKVPKKKGYADGGPVTDFSWDDYYKRLDAWKDASAQSVPQDIVDYESKWIVPQIKTAQQTLNAALATKYGLQPGQAPNANQFLTADEAKAAIGDEAYATYLTNVQGYQSYRDKVAGSYKAPSSTAGAFDPTGEKYGPRHFNMFTLSPEQAAANVATTKAAGKPTSQAEANAQAAQPAATTTTETAVPQDATPTGGIMAPPGKETESAPAATGDQQAPAGPQYTKHVTNYGPTMYYVQKDGKQQQVTEQEFKANTSAPDAQVYLLDESTGLYDEQGQPKKPVLQQQAEPQKEIAPPKMKKGGKVGFSGGGKISGAAKKMTESTAPKGSYVDQFTEMHGVDVPKKKKGYADGGVVPPDSLTGDQLIAFEKLTTDAERQAYLDSIAAGTDGDIAELTNKQKAIASLAPVAGQLGAAGVNMIDVDPLNKNANIAQGAGAGALKGAGTGLSLGMNPALMAATGGLSAPIGAGAGAIVGAITGGTKGKKKYNAARTAADDSARANAMAASYQDSGYAGGGYAGGKLASKAAPRGANKLPLEQTPIILFGGDAEAKKRQGLNEGGKVVGAGTAKSDDIPARVQKGSFIVPAENAKLAEMIRKQHLPKMTGKAGLKQGGNTDDVYLSNGEHMFTPQEVAILKKQGIDVDGLAPNAETTGYGYADGGTVKPSKARKILSDGAIRGKELTPKQKRYFGWIAGKGMKEGGGVGEGDHGNPEQVMTEFVSLRQQWMSESDPEKKSAIFQKMKVLEPDYEYWKANPDAVAQYKLDNASKDGSFGKDKSTDVAAPVPAADQPAAPAKTGSNASNADTSKKPAASKSGELTPKQKAYQAAFLKEHGGIGGGTEQSPAPAEGESRFKAVATDPVDELLKKYDELTLAGKVGEAAEIEKQIADLGGQARLTAYKSKAGAGNTKTFIPASEADTAETATATGSTAGIPPSPIKRAYEAIGPAGVLAIVQTGLGLAQSMKDKAPVPSVDPVLLQRRNEAMQKANMGLSPAEYGNAANRIESNRANVMRSISGVAGGDVGTIVGNARMASIDANRSRLDLESANNRMQQQNDARADNLVAAVAQQRAQVFAQNMQMFNQQEAASAGLMNAGLQNLFGSISSLQNQKSIDERANKYGTVNFTFPGTTTP